MLASYSIADGALSRGLITVACLTAALTTVGVGRAADSLTLPAAGIELELTHAETYYWFGMAEQGNLAAFRKGLLHLDRVSSLVEVIPDSDPAKPHYLARIQGLRTDLDEQIEIAHDTLYGLFPMVRFLVRSIFADSTSLGTFEVIDDPTVMASTFAAKNLALTTIKQWTGRHQLDVVFTSVPHNTALENEALYVFNSHPKYFVHNLREVVDALDGPQLAEFQAGRVTPEVREALLDGFGVNDALVVLVREADVVDGDYFYILEGKIYHTGQDRPTHDLAVMGFSRDRNAQFAPIIATNLILLALAYGAFWLQVKFRQRAAYRVSGGTFFALPLVAFAVGRCTPWALGPLLKSMAPVPETLAIVSFWVPCIAGALMTVVPMAAFWLISKRLANVWPMFNLDGRAAAVFVGVAAGAVGYLSVPLLLYFQGGGIVILPALTISLVGLAYLLGRALDGVDRLSTSMALAPLLLSLFVGAAVFQCLALWAWAAAAVVAVACGLPVLMDVRGRAGEARPASEEVVHPEESPHTTASRAAVNVHRLEERAEHPRYQKLADYDRCWDIARPLLEGRTAHMALCGPEGCGLSSTATAIADDLAETLSQEGLEAIRMFGECSHAAGEPTPYGPFQKALARHFEIELLSAPHSKLAEIDAVLGDVFQSVIPFAGILFPGADESTGTQIVPSVVWMLKRLAKTNPIVLLIDDSQWLDESSRGLLKHLVQEFPPGGSERIAIIVAGHDETALRTLGFDSGSCVELALPASEQQVQILTEGVGLARTTAEEIIRRSGSSTVTQGGLFWPLQVVANLARADVFIRTGEGVALREGKWPDETFVPEEMREVLAEQLRRFPQYRMIIECAACACEAREFSASLVADALAKPRLELLADLDRIDRETSLLYDVRQRDDIFAFQSSIMLDVVRDELKVVERGPAAEVPQIIREHHARLGACLEKSLETNSHRLYSVANHYYAAGAAFADRGAKYCLEAARASCAVLDFQAAEDYLRRAGECAQVSGEAAVVEACRIEIECRRAHLTGQAEDHRQAARSGADYLRQHPDCSTRLMLSIAQIQFDAGKSGGDRCWLDRSLEIGQRVIDQSKSARDEASGRHFVGISLPPQQREQRRRQLREALALVEAAPDGTEDYELLGRIMGSLAEELSRGRPREREEAKSLFEQRLRINETHRVGDPRGQAMTHGGLGRLAFYNEPQDVTTAAFHFRKDLEISEAIGDQQGQIQMHSLLGACALAEDNVPEALEHYQRSWSLSRHAINQFFAGAGLLSCHGRSRQLEPFHEVAGQLLALAREGVPDACADELLEALTTSPTHMLDTEAAELLSIVRAAISSRA